MGRGFVERDDSVGTALGISVRTGNSPSPDGSWTGFTPLGASGAAIPAVSRYLQYAAVLTTADVTRTPVLNDVTINYVGGVDSTPPDTAITSGPMASTSSTDATFTFTSTKAGGVFGCSLDSAAFVICSTPQLYSGLAAGNHNFRVRAADAALNLDPTPASFNWTIDLGAPDTAIVSAPPAAGPSATASFSFASTKPNSTFGCSLDGGPFATCASPVSYNSLVGGTHIFMVRAIDSLGNADPTPASFTWTVGSGSLSSFGDSTAVDFSAGTPVAGIFVGKTPDGYVSLAATVGADFSGAGLPAGWFNTNYSASGGLAYSGGVTSVNGTRLGTNASYNSGRSLEFTATFSGGVDYQDIGFAADLRMPPWAIFGTWGGGSLYARSQNAANALNTPISGSCLGPATASVSIGMHIEHRRLDSTAPSWRLIRSRLVTPWVR